jgi:ABC-type sugar transport system ATPase subunit
MASVRFENVDKTYPGGAVALCGFDLSVADGERLVLVGPSGSGKTTALRVVAGLEQPTRGRIHIAGRDVTDLPPHRRDVAMVFQSHALYPHQTVRQNLEFGLKMRGAPADVRAERVARAAEVLGLQELLDRRPAQLSAGERQRVALGRAMVREPRAFLLDEPFSNLDAQLRVQMRAELARLHRRLGTTLLHVTHDQEEAMTVGQRLAVLDHGRLRQVGPPMELYHRPADLFVAGFIGSPAMNFLPGPRLPFAVPAGEKAEVVVGVRPHDLRIVGPAEGDLRGKVEVVQRLGNQALVHVGGDDSVAVLLPAGSAPPVGEEVGLRFERAALHVFDARDGRRVK